MRRNVAVPTERRLPSAVPGATRPCGISGLSFSQIITLWRLHRGGLSVADASRVIDVNIHGTAARAAVSTFQALITSPLEIKEPVRCGGCGALLLEIPCVACGSKAESYRISKPRLAA